MASLKENRTPEVNILIVIGCLCKSIL